MTKDALDYGLKLWNEVLSSKNLCDVLQHVIDAKDKSNLSIQCKDGSAFWGVPCADIPVQLLEEMRDSAQTYALNIQIAFNYLNADYVKPVDETSDRN